MSISNAQRTRLGLFMIIGAVLCTAFIVIPVGFKLRDNTALYYSEFVKGESVSGLVEGAEVKYNGVKIGNIDKIYLDPKDFTKVVVTHRIDLNKISVTEGMCVSTGFMGITGLLYIEITGGGPDQKVLKPGSKIPTKPSLMYLITGKAETIITKVELLINKFNTIMHPDSSINVILKNVAALTHPDSLASIKKILDNVASITNNADVFMADLSPMVTNIASSAKNTMIKVDSISKNVHSITRKFDKEFDMSKITSILNQVDSTVLSMKALVGNLDVTVKQSQEDIMVSMENLREALENANQLTKILVENPSLIIKGETLKERRLK